MKKLIFITSFATVALAGAVSAQSLIAAWDFSGVTGSGLDFNGDFTPDTQVSADLGSGTFFFGNQTGGGFQNSTNLGSNLLLPNGVDTLSASGVGWQIGESIANPSLSFDLTGYQSATLSFAHEQQTGTGLVLNVVFGATNGTVNVGSEGVASFDISELAGGAGSVQFSLSSFDTGDVLAMDNFQISGTVVPEPSSFAAICGVLVLGFTATRRRVRK